MLTHDEVIAEDHRVARIAAREWRRGARWSAAMMAIAWALSRWLWPC